MTPAPDAVDRVLVALADPMRRRILDGLAATGDATATTLAAGLPVSRQAVVKHLAVLGRAGLVLALRSGREVHYRLCPQPLDATSRWMAGLATAWDGRLQGLKHLAEAARDTGAAVPAGLSGPVAQPGQPEQSGLRAQPGRSGRAERTGAAVPAGLSGPVAQPGQPEQSGQVAQPGRSGRAERTVDRAPQPPAGTGPATATAHEGPGTPRAFAATGVRRGGSPRSPRRPPGPAARCAGGSGRPPCRPG
ncbi:hypothetical protein GCM10010495_69820 [Kitasatospora herbaricolor]|nr:DNA-binding transcriptional ArsR family regulator [Kitasatospora herbaricolor]GGV42276.1 hypothetical protein GCM10010495_69820 [Kitasatospora herbaricolor]